MFRYVLARITLVTLFVFSVALFQLSLINSLHSLAGPAARIIRPAYETVRYLEGGWLPQWILGFLSYMNPLIWALLSNFAWKSLLIAAEKLEIETVERKDALKLLLAKSDAESALVHLQTVEGLRINIVPPSVVGDFLLNALLPEICRECFQGDLCELYQTKTIPLFVAKYGPTAGFLAARNSYRTQTLFSVRALLWYRLKILIGIEASLYPRDRDI